MTAGPIEDDHGWRQLDPRYLNLAREGAWIRLAIWGAILLLAAAIAWWIAGPGLGVGLVIALCWLLPMLISGALWHYLPRLRYRHAAWRIDEEGLTIRGGAWWRTESRVPRSRIQHTDVGQGPLERRHGLGHLVTYTAGTHHGEITLRGIAHEDAMALRDQLLQREHDAPV